MGPKPPFHPEKRKGGEKGERGGERLNIRHNLPKEREKGGKKRGGRGIPEAAYLPIFHTPEKKKEKEESVSANPLFLFTKKKRGRGNERACQVGFDVLCDEERRGEGGREEGKRKKTAYLKKFSSDLAGKRGGGGGGEGRKREKRGYGDAARARWSIQGGKKGGGGGGEKKKQSRVAYVLLHFQERRGRKKPSKLDTFSTLGGEDMGEERKKKGGVKTINVPSGEKGGNGEKGRGKGGKREKKKDERSIPSFELIFRKGGKKGG